MFLFCGLRSAFVLIVAVGFFESCGEVIKGLEADSWGYEFIFMFPPPNSNAKEIGMHLVLMDKNHNYTVNVEYSEVVKDGKLVKRRETLFFKHHLQCTFANALLYDIKDGLHKMKDVRFHIFCKTKMSVFAYTIDSNNAIDYFMVYPVGMAGNYYAFSLPAPQSDGTISLFFLPLGGSNATVMQNDVVHNVTINVSRQNKMTKLMQRMEAGSLWQYTVSGAEPISVWIRDKLDVSANTTVRPVRSKKLLQSSTPSPYTRIPRLLIIVSIRKLGAKPDYGCFMPTSMIVDECAPLTTPDFHPTQKNYSSNLYITAPTPHCPPEPVLVNTSTTNSKPVNIKWDQTATKNSVTDYSPQNTYIINSATTIMNIVQVGVDGNGAFIREIPAYSQWANGDIPVVIRNDTKAYVIIVADDYGREATIEGVEYPDFEPAQDMSVDIGIFVYAKEYTGGVYRIGIDQEVGGRYVVLVSGKHEGHVYGYTSSTNNHKIPPPIFIQPSTTTGKWTTTESPSTTTPVVVTTTTTVTTTRDTSLTALSTNLFVICMYLAVFSDNGQRTVI